MSRQLSVRALNLWMNGIFVGVWEQARSGERLAYEPRWVEDEQGRPLSLSLPFTEGNRPIQGRAVSAFFENLLPDSQQIRRRLAQRYKTGGIAPFDLLATLGRDCVGAIQLLPPDVEPVDLQTTFGDPLTESKIARLLRETTTVGEMGHRDLTDDLRLSIAGAQEKTALLRVGRQWLLPKGSTPTTHIFKLPLGRVGNMQADMRTSVENEWLCSRIFAAFGLPIANCEIARFADQKVLVVERFDRRPSRDGSWILRLPQEDMCQATGTPSMDKYQADGGPGIEKVMSILGGSENGQEDRVAFFRTQVLFWLLAATDGHAKNFSVAHLPRGRYRATPLYDILSAHPIIGRRANQLAPQKAKLAMAVRTNANHYLIEQIQRRHWVGQGRRVQLEAHVVEQMMDDIAGSVAHVIDVVSAEIPSEFPLDMAEAIFKGMRTQAKRLSKA